MVPATAEERRCIRSCASLGAAEPEAAPGKAPPAKAPAASCAKSGIGGGGALEARAGWPEDGPPSVKAPGGGPRASAMMCAVSPGGRGVAVMPLGPEADPLESDMLPSAAPAWPTEERTHSTARANLGNGPKTDVRRAFGGASGRKWPKGMQAGVRWRTCESHASTESEGGRPYGRCVRGHWPRCRARSAAQSDPSVGPRMGCCCRRPSTYILPAGEVGKLLLGVCSKLPSVWPRVT